MTLVSPMELITPWRLLRSLRKTPIMMETLLSPITPEHARRSPGDPNEWSIIEILCHLRDYEQIFFQRATLILQEEEPLLPIPESNDVMAALGQYKQQELSGVLASLQTTRQAFLQVLSELGEEQWMRKGRHNDSFPVTLKEVALQVIMHASLWLQFASGVVVTTIAACWYITVACVFSFGPLARGYVRIKKWIDFVTGGVLVALGVRLAVSK